MLYTRRLVDSMKFGLRTTMQSQTDTIKVYPHDSFIADPQHKYAEWLAKEATTL